MKGPHLCQTPTETKWTWLFQEFWVIIRDTNPLCPRLSKNVVNFETIQIIKTKLYYNTTIQYCGYVRVIIWTGSLQILSLHSLSPAISMEFPSPGLLVPDICLLLTVSFILKKLSCLPVLSGKLLCLPLCWHLSYQKPETSHNCYSWWA